MYGEVQAQHVTTPNLARHRLLATNAYMVQHSGVPEPRSIQSVAVHLMGLYWELEQHRPSHQVMQLMQRATDQRFIWLEPPTSLGALTILDVAAAQHVGQHSVIVQAWAEATWMAWQPYHPIVAAWAQAVDE